MAPRTIAEIVKLAGVPNIGSIETPQNRFHVMSLGGTGVAAGAAYQDSEKAETGSVFAVAAIVGRAWCSAAFGAAIAGSEFSRNGQGLIANNTMPPYNLVTVEIFSNSQPLVLLSNWLDVIGTIENPNVLDFPLLIPGGADVKARGTNGTTATMGWSISLLGAYIRK